WLAREIGKRFPVSVYLNYDRREDREIIRNEAWLDTTNLLILDELHKMEGWKNYIKGVYDTKPEQLKILVTGSARLETFSQGGDSLAGRYFRHRLFPFSPSELAAMGKTNMTELLITRSGFPEPLIAENDIDAERWRMQYVDALIREDILDFEKIHDLKAIQLVLELLRDRVGSPVSYTSIAEDVGIAPNTVKKYISIFESLYIIFRVTPFSHNIARSILKEPKIYFFDTGLVRGNEGVRFENLTALSLLKYTAGMYDYKGKNYELKYLRTKEGKEVDFCIVLDNKPELILEVKNSDSTLSKNLLYFHQRYTVPALQIVFNIKREKKIGDIEIRDGVKFLSSLDF
ncbi:MAG TPA: AAA family ATPase, partial [Spirochaetota bacterium]|nr:AAA family ATPase [Spirochaetota bacterium]